MSIARGSFEVTVTQVASDALFDGEGLGRMLLEKSFSGDLVGSGRGQMLCAGDPAAGTAGYVAIERVSGSLAGRSGSFALQHYATMTAGRIGLTIEVVPGSGRDELAGLSGRLSIEVTDGTHHYSFEYLLPEHG